MCAQHITTRKYNSLILYFISITLGILVGLSNIEVLQTIGTLISDLFIKIFKCISLPIIALSIIVTLSSYKTEDSMKRIWQRSIVYTLSTTIIAASVAFILYLIISPSNVDLVNSAETKITNSKINYFDHLMNLIPDNIFAPFLQHQVMGVLIVGIVIGIATRYIKDESSHQAVSNFFKGVHSIFLIITGWIVSIIPIGLFGFISTTVVALKEGVSIQGIGQYLCIVLLANVIQGFIVLPLWLKFNKINPFVLMKAMLPALSIAFFSKSSSGTLPVTIKTIEKNAGVNPKISRFVLPLCTTINMNGCSAFIFATVVYLMQNNGIELSMASMLLWIFISTIAAVGNAGVPMGCFFLSASLLASMNIPITLLGIILPFYSIIDMVETALNVWSDSCVAKVIDKKTV